MKIKELLSDESKWTQGCMARDEHGYSVDSVNKSAASWCLAGAAQKCYPPGLNYLGAMSKLDSYIPGTAGVITFNDHAGTTFADIQRLLQEVDV